MSERILIAEDDDNVRLMLFENLMLAGYSVSAVDNGLDLMRLAASSSGFDLIITDVCMPKGEGDDLISLLREKKILTPAILVTAYYTACPPQGVPILLKPFTRDDLQKLVAEMLNPALCK